MAWTTPRTWTDGELVTASIMNTHVKANQDAMGPHLIVRKPSNETFAATTTLQDDNDLTFPVAANEVWLFNIGLIFSTGAGGLKGTFSIPAGSTLYGGYLGFDSAGSASWQDHKQTASDTPTFSVIVNATTGRYSRFEGTYIGAGTAGNVLFRWAYSTASGTTTVLANSTLWASKIA